MKQEQDAIERNREQNLFWETKNMKTNEKLNRRVKDELRLERKKKKRLERERYHKY